MSSSDMDSVAPRAILYARATSLRAISNGVEPPGSALITRVLLLNGCAVGGFPGVCASWTGDHENGYAPGSLVIGKRSPRSS